jgi:hypothetical protein
MLILSIEGLRVYLAAEVAAAPRRLNAIALAHCEIGIALRTFARELFNRATYDESRRISNDDARGMAQPTVVPILGSWYMR